MGAEHGVDCISGSYIMAIVIVAITDNCWENRIKIILCVIINYNFMVNGENSNVIMLFIYLVRM